MLRFIGRVSMAWCKTVLSTHVNVKSQIYSSGVISLLTLYTFGMLTLMDILLLRTIKGYQSVDSYWLGALIFFVVSHIFLHPFRVYKWKNYLFYYIGGLAIFFPLVVLASIIRVVFNLSESGFMSYTEIYCPAISVERHSTGLTVCGQAFAYIVYSMTVRALPIVITIPTLYRFFYIEFPVIFNRLVSKIK